LKRCAAAYLQRASAEPGALCAWSMRSAAGRTFSVRSTPGCHNLLELYSWLKPTPGRTALWQQMAGRSPAFARVLCCMVRRVSASGRWPSALMAHLLCNTPNGLEACATCKSCMLLAAGSHPDNYILEPEEADKPIKVDQVRDLVSFVVQTAQIGRAQGGADRAGRVDEYQRRQRPAQEPRRAVRQYGPAAGQLTSRAACCRPIKSRCVQQACPLPGEADEPGMAGRGAA
jgi:DNA polymerase-3 subunit delta'